MHISTFDADFSSQNALELSKSGSRLLLPRRIDYQRLVDSLLLPNWPNRNLNILKACALV